MYELAEKQKAKAELAVREASSGTVALPFEPPVFRAKDAMDEPSVLALRSYAAKANSGFLGWSQGVGSVAALLGVSFPSAFVGIAMAAEGSVVGTAISGTLFALGSGTVALGFATSRKEVKLLKRTRAVREELAQRFQDWLKDVYGLSLIPSSYYSGKLFDTRNPKDPERDDQIVMILDLILTGNTHYYSSGWRLQNQEGVELRAQLVAQEDGAFVLKKVSIGDTSESPYITPLPNRSTLEAAPTEGFVSYV